MVYKIKLIFYYLFISKIPHSRLSKVSGKIRLWYVSRILRILPFDENSKFETGIYISNGKELNIGRHVRINENVFLQGKITIGNYVMIAPNVSIYSSTHIYDNPPFPMVLNELSEPKPVLIEDDVWIGRNSIILPGIFIGKGSIVGANSVVNKDVKPYSVVGGVPAKKIKSRINNER